MPWKIVLSHKKWNCHLWKILKAQKFKYSTLNSEQNKVFNEILKKTAITKIVKIGRPRSYLPSTGMRGIPLGPARRSHQGSTAAPAKRSCRPVELVLGGLRAVVREQDRKRLSQEPPTGINLRRARVLQGHSRLPMRLYVYIICELCLYLCRSAKEQQQRKTLALTHSQYLSSAALVGKQTWRCYYYRIGITYIVNLYICNNVINY